jgi:hypothetical protein
MGDRLGTLRAVGIVLFCLFFGKILKGKEDRGMKVRFFKIN